MRENITGVLALFSLLVTSFPAFAAEKPCPKHRAAPQAQLYEPVHASTPACETLELLLAEARRFAAENPVPAPAPSAAAGAADLLREARRNAGDGAVSAGALGAASERLQARITESMEMLRKKREEMKQGFIRIQKAAVRRIELEESQAKYREQEFAPSAENQVRINSHRTIQVKLADELMKVKAVYTQAFWESKRMEPGAEEALAALGQAEAKSKLAARQLAEQEKRLAAVNLGSHDNANAAQKGAEYRVHGTPAEALADAERNRALEAKLGKPSSYFETEFGRIPVWADKDQNVAFRALRADTQLAEKLMEQDGFLSGSRRGVAGEPFPATFGPGTVVDERLKMAEYVGWNKEVNFPRDSEIVGISTCPECILKVASGTSNSGAQTPMLLAEIRYPKDDPRAMVPDDYLPANGLTPKYSTKGEINYLGDIPVCGPRVPASQACVVTFWRFRN